VRTVASFRSAFAALMLTAAGCSPAAAAEDAEAEPSILDSVPALAGARQFRDALADRGFRFSGFYFSDPRANLHGGMREGATYSGLFSLALDVDFEKVARVEGGRLHASMFQIHGKDVSERYVGNILAANDIGARPTTRLFELYYEQQLGERLELQFGQMAADEEFMISDYAETFIGATLGWSAAPSENLPQEGPAYPLASLGAQVAWKATESFSLVGAIYNSTPANPDALDPQKNNPHGLNFRLGDPPLVILEGRYRYEEGLFGLPGGLKFGGYAHFGRFDDLKRGTDGLALGPPGSNGEPRRLNDNLNVFAILDQQVWRAPGGDDDDGVGIFARAIFGGADRNPINVYLDGGMVAKGVVPGRPADAIGLAVAYAGFSPQLRDAERAAYRADGTSGAVSRFEAIVEATYKAEITPGLTVQPTLQYVMRPNGGPPEDGGRRIPNATIFGVTTVVTF
jgi:porin